MNKPPDETLKQGRNRSWLLVNIELKIKNKYSPSNKTNMILFCQKVGQQIEKTYFENR